MNSCSTIGLGTGADVDRVVEGKRRVSHALLPKCFHHFGVVCCWLRHFCPGFRCGSRAIWTCCCG